MILGDSRRAEYEKLADNKKHERLMNGICG